MNGTGLRFETMEHGGEYPDTMPQAIKVTDAEGHSCIPAKTRTIFNVFFPIPTSSPAWSIEDSPDQYPSIQISPWLSLPLVSQ
jgi:hypothetical protein